MASKLHLHSHPLLWGGKPGCPMLSWTSDNAIALPSPDPKPKSKYSLLPVLVVLFLISYGLMSLLVVEQGRTIDNQRALIQSLFSDSTQLSQLKSKALQKQHAEAQAQAAAKAHSQAQTPSTQDKSRDQAQNKLRKPVPQKPPTDAVDRTDERRITVSI